LLIDFISKTLVLRESVIYYLRLADPGVVVKHRVAAQHFLFSEMTSFSSFISDLIWRLLCLCIFTFAFVFFLVIYITLLIVRYIVSLLDLLILVTSRFTVVPSRLNIKAKVNPVTSVHDISMDDLVLLFRKH